MSLVVSQAVDSPLTRAAIFLVVALKPGGRNTVLGLCADLSSLLRGVGFRDPSGALSCVLGFGASAWDELFATPRPAGLHPFREIKGQHHAPATPGDLLFHMRATRLDMCLNWRPRSCRAWKTRPPWWTRCTASSSSTSAICSALSTAPRTRPPRPPCRPR